MEIKEKQVLVTTISMIAIFVIYSMYVYSNYIQPNYAIVKDSKFWGEVFLYLIPITIVAQIFILIIFGIINKMFTNEDFESKTDERDKFIELRALKISHWVFSGGFILAMLSLAFDFPLYFMFVSLISSCFLSGIASGIAKIYMYRKGF